MQQLILCLCHARLLQTLNLWYRIHVVSVNIWLSVRLDQSETWEPKVVIIHVHVHALIYGYITTNLGSISVLPCLHI